MHGLNVKAERLPLSVALGWASGSLAMSIMYQATNVLLLRYLVDFMGLAASLAGTMIGASKLFDAFIDPMIGIASDRTRSRWGRRRPYLFVGGLLCAGAFLALFLMPVIDDPEMRVIVIEVALVALAAGYGTFNIPYVAMPAEMDIPSAERTRLISFRIAAVSIGGIAAVFFGPIIIAYFGGGRYGHGAMAIMISAIIFVSSMACFWFTRHAPVRALKVDPAGKGLGEQFRLAMQNKPFFLLISSKLLTLFGGGLLGAAQPFLFLQLLKSDYTVMGFAFLASSLMLIVTQPLWVRVASRTGNKRLYMTVAPLGALVGLSWLFAQPHEPLALIFLRTLISGFLGGATLLTQQAMLPDTIEYDYRRTGLRREGGFAGVYTTVEKVSAAVAASAVGLLLAAFGYVASTTGGAEQPDAVLSAIRICYAGSAACSVLSALVLWRYRLED